MATAPSRAWMFPTSPRSPYKIQSDLKLLKQFDGLPWNGENQLKYQKLLKDSASFEGEGSINEGAFSARDRVRAPSILGLIVKEKVGGKTVLRFTDAGNLYLDADELLQQLLLERQILKVQFPSINHSGGHYSVMDIRPLTFVVYLLERLGTLTKSEMALFVITTNSHKDAENSVELIQEYRTALKADLKLGARKVLRRELELERLKSIYAEDISLGHTVLREGGTEFFKTKAQTLNDYADSTFRYLRATGLFTLSQGRSIALSEVRKQDAIEYLKVFGMGCAPESKLGKLEYGFDYLGNPECPKLKRDLFDVQVDDYRLTLDALRAVAVASGIETYSPAELSESATSVERSKIVESLRKDLAEAQRSAEARDIAVNRSSTMDEVLSTYSRIASKAEDIIDRPLFYEWNTWRALNVINDAKNVVGNFVVDVDGNPSNTASGKKPDIFVEYEDFWLVVEVTLQSGVRQYETEGEPITRHVGQFLKERMNIGDKRPVFGLFVAEKINESVVQHLHLQSAMHSKVYGGKVQILPVNRESFCGYMTRSLEHELTSSDLFDFLNKTFSTTELHMDDLDWHSAALSRLATV